MLYQKINLATNEPIGNPGNLPRAVAGWAPELVTDLSGLDPAYGLSGVGFWPVADSTPSYDAETHYVVAGEMIIDPVAKSCTRTWTVQPNIDGLKAKIARLTQARLDDFAKTRGYDSILSASTYAASTVPQFKAEGDYAVAVRDSTWAALYQMLAEMEAGTRPIPTGFSDIEGLLPALEWPVV